MTINSGSNNNGTLYVNGVPEVTFIAPLLAPCQTCDFHLGNRRSSAHQQSIYWYGKIDRVEGLQPCLTANEVVEAKDVIEPVMDASWDNWKSSGGGSSDNRYFDRKGNKELSTVMDRLVHR